MEEAQAPREEHLDVSESSSETPVSKGENLWADLALDTSDDADETTSAPEQVTEEEPPAAKKPPAAPAPKPAKKAAAEAPSESQEEAPQAPSEPPAAQPSASPALSEEQVREQRTTWISALEKHYEMSEEEGAEFVSSPEKAFPKALASLHANIVEQAVHTVMAQLPQAITRYSEQTAQSQKNEQYFYEKWPVLNKPEYKETIVKVGRQFRQLYPTAERDEFVKMVGAQAAVMLGIPLEQILQTPTASKPAAAAPTKTQNPRELQSQFTPAGPGGGTPSPSTVPANPDFWAATAEEFDNMM